MAVYGINFAQKVGPEYEDYSIGVSTFCGADALQRNVKFDDIVTGDFVVGYNWNNPSGLPATTIVFESFTDITTVTEISSGNDIPVSVTPNALEDVTTGLDLVYPYTIDISDLANIQQHINNTELFCYDSGNPAYENIRTRAITYYILDSAGVAGPVRVATFINIRQ